jgi:putative membrane protein
VLGGLSIVGSVLQYVSVRYSIRDGSLLLSSGIIQRQRRTIPLERIQNINIKQELVHRLLGVADVRVETASGGDAEAVLSVVTMADAQAIRAALSERTNVGAPSPAGPSADVVYRASLWHLVLAGATQNRLGTLLAGVIGILFYINSIAGDEPYAIRQIVKRISNTHAAPGWMSVVLIGLALVAIGWVASMVLMVFNRYGFMLTRSQGQLHRTFGLLTRHESVFPVERVQVLRIIAPLLQRWAGLCRITAETAGSFKETEKQDSGTNELCPILERARAGEMSRLVLASLALDQTRFESIHPMARRRKFVRVLAALVLVIVPSAWFGSHYLWYGLAAAPFVAWLYAVLYYRSVGFAVDELYLVIRWGIWTRVIEVVPLTKVQASFVRQSPLQRWLGLATFEVLTAGSMFGNTVSVPDLALGRAISLQETAGERAESLPDVSIGGAVEPESAAVGDSGPVARD